MEVKQLESRIQHLNTQNQILENDLQVMKKNKSQLDKSVDYNEKRRELNLRDEVKDLNVELNKSKDVELKLNQMLNDLRQQLTNKMNALESVQDLLEKANKQNQDLNQQLSNQQQLTPIVVQPLSSTKVNHLQLELDRVKQERDELEMQMRMATSSSIQDDKLSLELSNLQKDYKKLKKEKEKLEVDLSQFDDGFFSEIDDMQNNLNRVYKENKLLVAENDKLKSQLKKG
ncbi:hypothetical protein AKO1_015640 [Acrasis kona]|uniref:Uncharacterized protein n=1 Tax=Acrasis kona TaxID=1008807 RepID=A0AAW2ZGZ8_9EUKA